MGIIGGKMSGIGIIKGMLGKKKRDKEGVAAEQRRAPVRPANPLTAGPLPTDPTQMVPTTPTVAARPATFRSGFRDRAKAVNEEFEGRRRRRPRSDDMR